jgi:hypothetical protein
LEGFFGGGGGVEAGDVGGAGVFEGVVDGFFGGEVEVVADFAGDGAGGDGGGVGVDAAVGLAWFTEVGGHASEVVGEGGEGVVFGVYGPDGFVEGGDELAGHVG